MEMASNGSHRDDVSQSTMAARSSKPFSDGNNTTMKGFEMNATMTTIDGSERLRASSQMVSKTCIMFVVNDILARVIFQTPFLFCPFFAFTVDPGGNKSAKVVELEVSKHALQEVLHNGTRATYVSQSRKRPL